MGSGWEHTRSCCSGLSGGRSTRVLCRATTTKAVRDTVASGPGSPTPPWGHRNSQVGVTQGLMGGCSRRVHRDLVRGHGVGSLLGDCRGTLHKDVA